MLEERLNQDLKAALLAGDSTTVSTLRTLKSTLLYAKLANGTREEVMDDEKLVPLLRKEAQKRQESADLYLQGGSEDRAKAELAEKAIIEKYLPAQLDEAEVSKLVDTVLKEVEPSGQPNLGAIIGIVKQRSHGQADGALIARLVKERLSQ